MKLSAALGSLQLSELGFQLVKLVQNDYQCDGEAVQIPEDWMVYALPRDKSDLPREIAEYDTYQLNECKDCLTDAILAHNKWPNISDDAVHPVLLRLLFYTFVGY